MIFGLLLLACGCSHSANTPSLPDTRAPDSMVRTTESDSLPSQPVDDPSDRASSEQADLIVDAIALMSSHGLDPEDYGLSFILSLPRDSQARRDALSAGWTLAATHLARGRLDAATLQPRRTADPQDQELFALMTSGGGSAELAEALGRAAPQNPAYLALRDELVRQRSALAMESDEDLQKPLAARVGQLIVNLERWRWLPHDLGKRYVIANIAGFQVTSINDGIGEEVRTAIFGKLTRETPTFSDSIEYVVFNPWWEVPDSIARHDKLAQFKRDPGAIGRLGYKILDRQGNAVNAAGIDWSGVSSSAFPYRIRQAPGPSNALGQVKIMFPNAHNVYLHDTPERELFDLDRRTFSSGCIRIQDPLGLAAWLLEDTPEWDQARIATVLATGRETRADLSSPVPVHIVYFTVVGDSCDSVQYLDDVYGRDTAILDAMKAPLLTAE
jgi:murein L,D-transpeptidase YcbB/YkuD